MACSAIKLSVGARYDASDAAAGVIDGGGTGVGVLERSRGGGGGGGGGGGIVAMEYKYGRLIYGILICIC